MSVCPNIADRLTMMAEKRPGKTAVIASTGGTRSQSWTFRQLIETTDQYAYGLEGVGVMMGMRALLMVRPGFDMIALSFALFKTGAVPVFIDPGMGKSALLGCVARSRPEALVAIPLAHMARLIYPRSFRSAHILVTAGRRWLWGGETLHRFKQLPVKPFESVATKEDDPAAILFTTGSTGPPKGVMYDHGIFDAQVTLIKRQYGITDQDIDFPVFPLFALFSIAMGMTVVIPDMDPAQPAKADPARLAEQIDSHSVTITFGSPAVWRRLSKYCVDHGVRLPTLTRVLMAGAPVAPEIHDRLLNHVLPEGAATYTPFGATEALPVCDIHGREVLDETAGKSREGKGTCVGAPLPGMEVRIVKIVDEVISEYDTSLTLPPGEIGEIVVSGPVVTRKYHDLPEQTQLAKIVDTKTGAVMHRMGDVGYLDEKSRLWFCGRKSHRVITCEGTLFTVPVEAIFNRHPDVFRTALVGLGDPPHQTPAIIVELDRDRPKRGEDLIAKELRELGAHYAHTRSIERVLFHPQFPTDVRHNAKIFREKLKAWAERKRV